MLSLLMAGSRTTVIVAIGAGVIATVIGIVPQTLKLTQASSEKLRQTTSLRTARNRKKIPQRRVSFLQPSSFRLKAALKT